MATLPLVLVGMTMDYFLEMEELIIEKVRQHEILYNDMLPNYKSQKVRQKTWEQIAKELRTTPRHAKDTWDKLRRCYLNAINRRRSNTSDLKRFPPWRFECQMSFLLPYLKPRKNLLQESPQEEETQLDLQIDEPDESDCFVKVEHEVEDDDLDDANEELSNDLMSLEPDREEVEESRPVKKARYQEQDDEDDMFFTSMFKMIKSLPPIEQARIKLTLGNAVLQAKLRVHEAASNVSSQEPSPCSSSTT